MSRKFFLFYYLKLIFLLFALFTSQFGIQLVKSFVEDLDGKVEFFSSTTNDKRLNKGTTVVIEFQQFKRKVKKAA
ncbi:MAG: hypothetical protein R3B45_09980 [Bdellovibrionota bacterium]